MSDVRWIKLISAAVFGALATFYAVTMFFDSAEVSNTALRQVHWTRSHLDVVRWVKDENWDVLEKEYRDLHRKYEAGEARWNEVDYAFDAFDYADPGLQPAFANWVKARPGSFVAHMARGLFLSNLVFATRGENYIGETHPEQIRGMVRYFQMAVPELKRAIDLNPAAVQAYARMMTIERFRGDYGGVWQTYVIGYFRSADATALTIGMMTALKSKWGGESSHRRWFNRFAHIAALFDPGFRRVLKIEDIEKAAIAEEKVRDYEAALKIWTNFLTVNREPWVYLRRANVLRKLGRRDEALTDILTAIEKHPEYAWAHHTAAGIYAKSGLPEKALKHFDAALLRNPYDTGVLVGRASVLAGLRRYSAAERDLENALVFGKWDSRIHLARARILRDPRANPEKAKMAFVRLLELKPSNERYLRMFTHWLELVKDCDFFPYVDRLLNICLRTMTCGRKDLDRYVSNARRARQHGQCKSVPELSRLYDVFFRATTNLDEAVVAGLKLGQGQKEIKAAYPDAVITPLHIEGVKAPVMYKAKRGSLQHPPRLHMSLTLDGKVYGIQVIEIVRHAGGIRALEKKFIEQYGPPDTRRVDIRPRHRKIELEYRQPGDRQRYAKTLTITLAPVPAKKSEPEPRVNDQVHVMIGLVDREITETLSARSHERVARKNRSPLTGKKKSLEPLQR